MHVNAFTASAPADLAAGRFQLVIDDEEIAEPARARRLVFSSGKVHVDLATSDARRDDHGVALARVEQLYPFPADRIREVIDRYPSLREICWAQEEPENMGAWEFVRPLFEELIDARWPLRYIGRQRNSSTSEGSATWHAANQRAIVAQVFEQKADPREMDRVLSKQV